MGREIRKVPAAWNHPKDARGRYIPLRDDHYAASLAEWEKAADLFSRGLWFNGEPLPPEAEGLPFEEWHGPRPRPEDYMPDWPEAERTHFQMYETTSEGTPKSPIFATPEEVARWCADNNVSAFGGMTEDYVWWLSVARGACSTGAIVTISTGEIKPG